MTLSRSRATFGFLFLSFSVARALAGRRVGEQHRLATVPVVIPIEEPGDGGFEELYTSGIVVLAALLFASIGLAMWIWNPHASEKKALQQSSLASSRKQASIKTDDLHTAMRKSAQRAALGWLSALVLVTLTLLVGQLFIGVLAHSLTLIADSAHTGADAVSYAFSYAVEFAKTRAVSSSGQRRLVVRLDVLSAVFSVVVIAGTSWYAAVDAWRRLAEPGAANGEVAGGHGGQEDRFIGPALLAFAVASTLANVALLELHRRRRQSVSSGVVNPTSEQGPSPLPPAPTTFQPPPPPAPPPPPPPPAAFAQGRRDRRRGETRGAARREQVAWLHQAFHPNCADDACPLGTTASASVGETPGSGGSQEVELLERGEASVKIQPDPEEDNLNLYGALLHLFTDVLRSVVIFVAGVLVQCGAVRNPAKTDAICALIVSACVVAGSAALLRGAVVALRRGDLMAAGEDRSAGGTAGGLLAGKTPY